MTGRTADDAAAAWYARLSSDLVDGTDHTAFEAWYEAAPGNREAWLRLERAAQKADEFALTDEARAMVAEALATPARDRAPADEQGRAKGRRLAFASLGAAVLAFGAIGWQLGLFTGTSPADGQVFATDLAEAPRDVTLEDGSRVTLDSASQIKVAAGSGGRTLELAQGQAFFRVAKDAAHPFTVTSGGYRVTALGTQFDVDTRDGGLDVGLVEGRVSVEALDGGKNWILEPGMLLTIRGGTGQVAEGRAEDSRSWIDGFISFDDAPLGEVVARLNRHLTHRLVLDPALEKRSFSGVVRTDSDDALIEALRVYGIARVGRSDDKETVLVPY